MNIKDHSNFIGTNAQVIISSYPVLARLIYYHGLCTEESHECGSEEKELPEILKKSKVEDALNGPMQNFFKQKIQAYAKISYICMGVFLLKDENLNSKSLAFSKKNKIFHSLDLKKIETGDLKKIEKELDMLTQSHSQKWDVFRNHWNSEMLQAITEQGFELSDLEKEEFLNPEPLSELLTRCEKLHIPLPEKYKKNMNFTSYFLMNVYILMHGILIRKNLLNSQLYIEQVLKKLHPQLNEITKQENKMSKIQKAVTKELIANAGW